MDVEISDDDGLVLKNIRLENRYMGGKDQRSLLHP